MEFEHPSCPLCGSEKRRSVYSKFPSYKVVRCRSCEFYYLYPRLTETAILKLYSDDRYFEGEEEGYTSYAEQEPALRATFRRLISNLENRKLTGGDLLEIGCGYGYLLDEAKGSFRSRVGTDFSKRAVAQATNRADFVYCGGIQEVPAQEKFDLIIATHVIEHVYQPHNFLHEITNRLQHGGTAVIATPNMGSFWRHLMGHRWPSFKLPEHVLYFDKKSLASAMEQAGLINIRLLPYPHAFPLPLVFSKLGLKLPSKLSKFSLWMPATTLALYGQFYGSTPK